MSMLTVSGQTLPEDSTNRVTECEGTILRGSCPANHVIAVKDVQYGTTTCALSASDPGCCDYDPTHCLTNYTGTTQQAACSGRELCNDATIGEEDTSSCGAPYPDLNHYLTMEYYCIPGKLLRNEFGTPGRNSFYDFRLHFDKMSIFLDLFN